MCMSEQVITVLGVTGTQGGAVARALRRSGKAVRGVTRKPGAPAARALEALGVEIVAGDLEDRASLERAFTGAAGAYVVTDFFKNGIAAEIAHGKRAADAAAAVGLPHFVYASTASADRATGVPHFASKWEIEQHIAALGIPATILRPTLFMEDLTEKKYVPPANWGMLARIVRDRPLKWIAVDDLAAAAAVVLSRPGDFIGKTIALAGDERPIGEARDIFERVDGKRPRRLAMPRWLFRRLVSRELVAMWEWLAEHSYDADVEATRRLLPGTLDLEAWLRRKRAASRDLDGNLAA